MALKNQESIEWNSAEIIIVKFRVLHFFKSLFHVCNKILDTAKRYILNQLAYVLKILVLKLVYFMPLNLVTIQHFLQTFRLILLRFLLESG